MNNEGRAAVYRGMIMTLACAIYNDEEGWDKQAVASLLHMGDPRFDYVFAEEPPDSLTDEDISAALDRIFEQAGI